MWKCAFLFTENLDMIQPSEMKLFFLTHCFGILSRKLVFTFNPQKLFLRAHKDAYWSMPWQKKCSPHTLRNAPLLTKIATPQYFFQNIMHSKNYIMSQHHCNVFFLKYMLLHWLQSLWNATTSQQNTVNSTVYHRTWYKMPSFSSGSHGWCNIPFHSRLSSVIHSPTYI